MSRNLKKLTRRKKHSLPRLRSSPLGRLKKRKITRKKKPD